MIEPVTSSPYEPLWRIAATNATQGSCIDTEVNLPCSTHGRVDHHMASTRPLVAVDFGERELALVRRSNLVYVVVSLFCGRLPPGKQRCFEFQIELIGHDEIP